MKMVRIIGAFRGTRIELRRLVRPQLSLAGLRSLRSGPLLHGERYAFDDFRKLRRWRVEPLLVDRFEAAICADLVDEGVQPRVRLLVAAQTADAHPLLVEDKLLLEVVPRGSLVEVDLVCSVAANRVDLAGHKRLHRRTVVIEAADI